MKTLSVTPHQRALTESTKYYDERNKVLLHKRICEEITAFADSHKEIPFYFILQVGVSKGAFKMCEFERGYKSFNADKVKQVHTMGMEYNKYNGCNSHWILR